jgi:hypothetical protein
VRERQRFYGFIAGLGTTSGTRIVVGRWTTTPYGPFSDVMVEKPTGQRVLLAPSVRIAHLISQTYEFDEVRVTPVTVLVDGADDAGSAAGPGTTWTVSSAGLRLKLTTGGRMPVGRLLGSVPVALASRTQWAGAVDPVASALMRGVHTRGTGRSGLRAWYSPVDLHRIETASGTLAGESLGSLAPVDPPTRFGFSSTPRTPSVTKVVSTVETDVT